jgi:hypothetical protein
MRRTLRLAPVLLLASCTSLTATTDNSGFLYATLMQPIMVWYGSSRGWPVPPEVNMDLLWVVITGMLGIGGLRTFEKVQKVTK